MLLLALLVAPLDAAPAEVKVPILVYHRFAATAENEMTVTTRAFELQLRDLTELGYTVITLRSFVEYRLGRRASLPPCPVIITADDGHRSVYAEMAPVVRRRGMPVTLFIYPSAISNAPYAMTWAELQELTQSGLFDVQSHTYWHPNFRTEKARLPPQQYASFVRAQLTKSRQVLEQRLGTAVDLLAWPFGIYDEDLVGKATDAGYVAAVTLERRPATAADPLMTLPRYLVREADIGAAFARLLAGDAAETARCTG